MVEVLGMSNLKGLWDYWNEPTPKVRLERVEEEEVSNFDALYFCIKFIMLALAIFFLGEFVRMIV